MSCRETQMNRAKELSLSAKGIIHEFASAHGCLELFVQEGRPAVELLTANPLVGFCLAVNEYIQQPAEIAPLSAARFYVTKPQREILAWLGFRPASEAVVKIGRKCVPKSLTIERCREFRLALREKQARKLLAHVPRINAGVMALVGEVGFLPYLTPALLLTVSQDSAEDTQPKCAELLRDIHHLDLELEHQGPRPEFSSISQMHQRHQELIAEIFRRGGRKHRERFFPPPPLDGIATNTLFITPVTTVGGLQALGRDQHNCVASYASRILAGQCYVYKVIADRDVWTLCISKNSSEKWEVSELKGLCNHAAPRNITQAVQQWLCQVHGNKGLA